MDAGRGFLTEDVKNLMQRLAKTLQDVGAKSAESSDHSSNMTFEPDSDNTSPIRTASVEPKRRPGRTPSPCIPEESSQSCFSPAWESRLMTRTISCEKFRSTTLRRMEERSRRNEVIRQQNRERSEEQFHEDTSPFHASERSKIIAGKIEPLPTRTAKILQDRSLKTKELQTRLAQQQEDLVKSDLTFKPRIKPYSRAKMTPNDFYEYNMRYVEEGKKTMQARSEMREREKSMALTLRPVLDPHSMKLAKRTSTAVKPGTRVSDFLKRREKKIEKLKKTLEPTFRPVICNHSRKLVDRTMTRPAHERLYTPPLIYRKGAPLPLLTIEPTPETQGSSPSTPRLSFNYDLPGL